MAVLTVIVEERQVPVEVADEILAEAGEFFDKIDRDMDQGWQMGREWLEHPEQADRCRIVADRLMAALESNNRQMQQLMAGYILARMPEVSAVRVNTEGELGETELLGD